MAEIVDTALRRKSDGLWVPPHALLFVPFDRSHDPSLPEYNIQLTKHQTSDVKQLKPKPSPQPHRKGPFTSGEGIVGRSTRFWLGLGQARPRAWALPGTRRASFLRALGMRVGGGVCKGAEGPGTQERGARICV